MNDCIFCKIIDRGIPALIVYEDESIVIFKDIEPKAKIHLLMVLKQHFPGLAEMNGAQSYHLGACLKTLDSLKDELGLSSGYRLIINQGADAGQTVFHLHVHIMGGEPLPW